MTLTPEALTPEAMSTEMPTAMPANTSAMAVGIY